MEKYTSGAELPVGLGLALEEYKAMDYFFPCPGKHSSRSSIILKRYSRKKKCWLMFTQ